MMSAVVLDKEMPVSGLGERDLA